MNYLIKIYKKGDENDIRDPTEQGALGPLPPDMTENGYAYTLFQKNEENLQPLGCGGFSVLQETENSIYYVAWVRISNHNIPWKTVLRLIRSGLEEFSRTFKKDSRKVELVAFVEEEQDRFFRLAEHVGFEQTENVYWHHNGKRYRQFFYRN